MAQRPPRVRNFVLFVVINFLTTKDTKDTKENAKEEGVP
jgi:hypothetical protein